MTLFDIHPKIITHSFSHDITIPTRLYNVNLTDNQNCDTLPHKQKQITRQYHNNTLQLKSIRAYKKNHSQIKPNKASYAHHVQMSE